MVVTTVRNMQQAPNIPAILVKEKKTTGSFKQPCEFSCTVSWIYEVHRKVLLNSDARTELYIMLF